MHLQVQLVIISASLLLQAILALRLIATQRLVTKLNARLVHQGEALSLLTDTSESGFGAIARELERLGTAARKPAIATRVAQAAKQGRTIEEIAAAEQVSEAEVRLRLLYLSGKQPAGVRAAC